MREQEPKLRVPVKVQLKDRWGTFMPNGDLFVEPYPYAEKGRPPTQEMQQEVERGEDQIRRRRPKWY